MSPSCHVASLSQGRDSHLPTTESQRMIQDPALTDVVIYHNPACGTSRNTLAIIRNAGVEPHVVEYLNTPPSRALLLRLVARMGVPLSALLREKGTPFADLGLGHPDTTDTMRLDAIDAHPILINRPIVVTPWGVKLCRPSEAVLDILPLPQRGPIAKEDGELIVDANGQNVKRSTPSHSS
jgi:arsenate reductase (glutaredoxin)